jgi:hypothetical protein
MNIIIEILVFVFMADQHKYVINLLESNIERKIDN